MTCQETGLLIHALADGELDLVKSIEIEAHLKECRSCAQAQENIRGLRSLMKDPSVRFTPAANFEKRLSSTVRREAKHLSSMKREHGFHPEQARTICTLADALPSRGSW